MLLPACFEHHWRKNPLIVKWRRERRMWKSFGTKWKTMCITAQFPCLQRCFYAKVTLKTTLIWFNKPKHPLCLCWTTKLSSSFAWCWRKTKHILLLLQVGHNHNRKVVEVFCIAQTIQSLIESSLLDWSASHTCQTMCSVVSHSAKILESKKKDCDFFF